MNETRIDWRPGSLTVVRGAPLHPAERLHSRQAVSPPCRLTIPLLALLGGLAGAGQAAHDGEQRVPHIYMLLYRGCEDACRGFQEYFRKQHLPVRFTIRDAAQDKHRVRELVAEARALRPDLLLTWGTTATVEAVGTLDKIDPQRHITDLPVLFMIVSHPAKVGLVRQLDHPGRNLSGTLYLLPAETQLRAARSYLPFKRLGFISNPIEANSQASRDELRTLAPRFGYTLVEREIPLAADGKPDAAALPALVASLARDRVDLLYMPPDSFLNSQRDSITGSALQQRLPVFAAAEAPVVKSQALFGVVNKYGDVGRFTAYRAAQILYEGKRPADLPIELPRRFSLLINMQAARTLQRYPPLKLLDAAELINPAPPQPEPDH